MVPIGEGEDPSESNLVDDRGAGDEPNTEVEEPPPYFDGEAFAPEVQSSG